MKIFKVEFSPMYPVPYGLIIAAKNIEEAMSITNKTIEHTKDYEIKEIDIRKSKVIFYESGDY